jgi:peptide chain release factor subunit 1
VLLANRRYARVFRGSAAGFNEVERVYDDVPTRHDQGGWSQARLQRHVDKEATDHLKRSADITFRGFQRWPFDNLLLGAPEDSYATLEDVLHPELKRRLRGRVRVDVENTSEADVHAAAKPLIEDYERQIQEDLLKRLQEGLGRDERAVAGLPDVLLALVERRVEALLLDEGFSAAGAECPSCGWLGPDRNESVCPVDGGALEQRDDVAEPMTERAMLQGAVVVALRDRPELGPHGGVAAVLRF